MPTDLRWSRYQWEGELFAGNRSLLAQSALCGAQVPPGPNIQARHSVTGHFCLGGFRKCYFSLHLNFFLASYVVWCWGLGVGHKIQRACLSRRWLICHRMLQNCSPRGFLSRFLCSLFFGCFIYECPWPHIHGSMVIYQVSHKTPKPDLQFLSPPVKSGQEHNHYSLVKNSLVVRSLSSCSRQVSFAVLVLS
jgi:hypothetical protein